MATTARSDQGGAVAGIVLAGGLSSRMGRDKARLVLGGQTLLQRACDLLAAAGAVPVRVSGPYPEHGGRVDVVARCGPLGGLHTMLQDLEDGWAWVIAVDMPGLRPAMLQRLRDAQPVSGAIYSGHPLPMLLKIDTACRNVLADRVRDPQGPHSLHALQRALGFTQVDAGIDERAGLVNCNTPEQWKDAAT